MRDGKFLLSAATTAEQNGDHDTAWTLLAELASSESYRKQHPEIDARLRAIELAQEGLAPTIHNAVRPTVIVQDAPMARASRVDIA